MSPCNCKISLPQRFIEKIEISTNPIMLPQLTFFPQLAYIGIHLTRRAFAISANVLSTCRCSHKNYGWGEVRVEPWLGAEESDELLDYLLCTFLVKWKSPSEVASWAREQRNIYRYIYPSYS